MVTQNWTNWTLEKPPVDGAFLTEHGWEINLAGTNPADGFTELLVAIGSPSPNVVAGAANIIAITIQNKLYDVGEVVTLKVKFNEKVVVTTTGGTPSIPITVGSNSRNAVYASGSGKNILNFTYTVQANEVDLNGIAITGSAIALNSGTIVDSDGQNNANLSYSTLTLTYPDVVVDAANRTITDVLFTDAVDVDTAGTISITTRYNAPVIVTGAPRIPMFANNGTTPLAGTFATYLSGSGTIDIVYRYTVVAGDSEATGIKIGANVALNGGTITATPNAAKTVTNTFTQRTTTITLNQA